MVELLRSRGAPIAVSCLLHAGLVAGLVLGQQWVTVALPARPPVLPVQLVTLDAQEEPRERPAPPPRAPVRPPRLREIPRPKPAPPQAEPQAEPRVENDAPAPPAAPIAQTVPPPPPAPVAGGTPLNPAEPTPPASSPAAGAIVAPLPAPGPSAAPAPTAALARPSAASEGVTQYARPQGGYQVRPAYPAVPRRLGIQGTTLLRVHVQADGRIGEVLVEKSAGHPELDDAAVDAVKRWRFEPARRGAEAIAMWVLLPVEFRLR